MQECLLNPLTFSCLSSEEPIERIWERRDTNILPFTFTRASQACYSWFDQHATGQDFLLVRGLTTAIRHCPVVGCCACHNCGFTKFLQSVWLRSFHVSTEAGGQGQSLVNDNDKRFNQILADWCQTWTHMHMHAHTDTDTHTSITSLFRSSSMVLSSWENSFKDWAAKKRLQWIFQKLPHYFLWVFHCSLPIRGLHRLTNADLVIRLSISDALKLELLQRLRKPLNSQRKTWEAKKRDTLSESCQRVCLRRQKWQNTISEGATQLGNEATPQTLCSVLCGQSDLPCKQPALLCSFRLRSLCFDRPAILWWESSGHILNMGE